MPAPRRPQTGRTIQISRGADDVTQTPDVPAQRGPRQQRERPNGAARARARRPAPAQPKRSSDLLGRILVAVPAAVLAIVFADLGGVAWMLLMIAFGLACTSELYRMLDEWKPLTIAGFVVVAGMCVAAHFGGERYMVTVAVAALPLTFIGILMRGDSEGSTLAIGATFFGVLWLGFAFAHGVLLRDTQHGLGLVIDVMVGTFIADIAAYFGGRWFGRHPLAPTISPKKTIEGFFCGAIAAVLAVFVASEYQPWLPHGTALALGFAIAILGPIGDLFESLIKRDVGAKDAGTMFGAHGGALDRLDAVSFTIIATYYIWVLIPHS